MSWELLTQNELLPPILLAISGVKSPRIWRRPGLTFVISEITKAQGDRVTISEHILGLGKSHLNLMLMKNSSQLGGKKRISNWILETEGNLEKKEVSLAWLGAFSCLEYT